ncbi:MAG: hypothetical protein CL424_09830 [Acidimicrobiaceae bacterium]|nr:hypothetical protein [Acidimicrobiaceae bacterium]
MFERDEQRDHVRERAPGRLDVDERAVSTPLGSSAQVFAKLDIGAVDSPFEREADRIAGQVMRKLDTDAAASGDSDIMTRMETAFGADFSGVRLHTDGDAAGMSSAVRAKAFAHGNDIYFGAGQFRPDTRDGQELLAHELTHTLQQGGAGANADADVARRSPLPSVMREAPGTVRRWALDDGVDLTQITALRTAGTAQQTFMAKDQTGKEIVIKPGSVSMNLLQLADAVHESVHKTDYVKSYAVDAGQKAVLAGKIGNSAVSSHKSWEDSGKVTPGPKLDGETDADKARRVFAQMVTDTKQPLTAMRIVDGQNGKQLSREFGGGANKAASAMRSRLESPAFMRSVGHAIVTDLFTGNQDRFPINLGNFMSTGTDNLTLIDNMDMFGAKRSFNENNSDDWIDSELIEFAKNRTNYVASNVNRLLRMIASTENSVESEQGINAWADEPGTNRRRFMVEDVLKGADEASARITTVYSKNKKKSEGRALKKTIKGIEQDDNQIDFWEIMKARAMVLRDPGKAQKMVERLKKRHAAAKKKAAKKKRR